MNQQKASSSRYVAFAQVTPLMSSTTVFFSACTSLITGRSLCSMHSVDRPRQSCSSNDSSEVYNTPNLFVALVTVITATVVRYDLLNGEWVACSFTNLYSHRWWSWLWHTFIYNHHHHHRCLPVPWLGLCVFLFYFPVIHEAKNRWCFLAQMTFCRPRWWQVIHPLLTPTKPTVMQRKTVILILNLFTV